MKNEAPALHAAGASLYNVPMNVFVAIMLIFAAAGFTDQALGGRWGLGTYFQQGLQTMGSMVIPIVSICAVGTEFIQRHTDQVGALSEHLFFDPSMIIGALLAPDMGGYFICQQIAGSEQILVLSGVVLGTLLGQAITFQMPVFMSSLDKADHPLVFRGFTVGIAVIPAGMIACELMLRMPVRLFLRQLAPVLVLSLVIAAGLAWAPQRTGKIFAGFARVMGWIFDLMFAITILGLFIPSLQYASLESVEEAVLIVFKCAIIIGGALVMSQLIMKLFHRQIHSISRRLGIGEVATVALLMTCTTSLAILPLFGQMDEKGKQIVSAFSLSGSFVIGGSMAFVSNVTGGYQVLIFIVSKLVCGILSAWIMHRMISRRHS